MIGKAADAVERAEELLLTPLIELPSLAADYADYLCKRNPGSDDVIATAFAHYAQVVEKLPCAASALQADRIAHDYFAFVLSKKARQATL